MEQCYACKDGRLKKHGSFKYCSHCSYAEFVMTNDYVSSAAVMIGTLVSNTKFETAQGWIDTVSQLIQQHTPILANFTTTMDQDSMVKFTMAFAAEVIDQAINLELPEEIMQAHGASKEPDINIDCQGCGSLEFIYDSNKPLATCRDCAVQHFIEATGNLIPIFKCECSGIRFDEIDELLVQCSNCRQPYMKLDGGLRYQKVGG